MKNHLARRGGIWWARLAVPARLRESAGRREFTRSTRTHELHVAKLIAAVMIADWRMQLMKLESRVMNPTVLNLLEPAPALSIGGTISIERASQLGVERTELLRIAAAGRLVLHCRVSGEQGSLINMSELEVDPATNEREIPPWRHLPASSLETVQSGVLALSDSKEIANVLLAEGFEVFEVVALESPGRPERLFVPARAIQVHVGRLEVSARAVQTIREHMTARLPADQVERAYQHRAEAGSTRSGSSNRRGAALFSQAVEAYCTDHSGLPSDLTSTMEQRQRRAGLMLFAEFMGDLRLDDVTPDTLRSFRDGPLRTLPAKANNLRKPLRRATMRETIDAIADAGVDWPTMTADMQQERMRWLGRLFGWLNQKEWIAANPTLPLKGETGFTKADQKQRRRTADDEDETGRDPFSPEELSLIFGQSWFSSGTGAHISKPRFWYPFEYWLPALGLYAGCRIKEASQLHLADVRQVDGVWVLDINEATPDKTLKNKQSRRQVPLHPRLVEMGFLTYCDRLKAEGFRRVFPELTWAKTDARYAKETIRKMSRMLELLGMPRNGQKVFHCLRHNLNNALLRLPASALPYADDHLRKFIRYTLLGHQPGDDVNVRHYVSTTISERLALITAVEYGLPSIAPLDIEFAIRQVKTAMNNKIGERHGREDMGPAEAAS
jgi:integrase